MLRSVFDVMVAPYRKSASSVIRNTDIFKSLAEKPVNELEPLELSERTRDSHKCWKV